MCFSVAPEIINPMKLALEEQKLYLETSLLNVSTSSPATPALASISKRQPEEHIDYLIKQGKICAAIEQVSTVWSVMVVLKYLYCIVIVILGVIGVRFESVDLFVRETRS